MFSKGRHVRNDRTVTRSLRNMVALVVGVMMLLAGSIAAADVADVDNIADVIHPNIHQNVGDGTNANPGVGNDNGNGLHGIANNPGQSGDKPNDDGTNGFANELNTVHGGIDEVNPQVGD